MTPCPHPALKKLWALQMLFVWRWRLGYWDWDAFKVAWLLALCLVLSGCAA